MPSNSAAWLVEKTKPLEVGPAPYTAPGENEIVVKNAAVAINPVDGAQQALGFGIDDYPAILGHDVAGQVVEVGTAVTRFHVGDRVLGNCVRFATMRNSEGGFQEYTVLKSALASPIPSTMSFEVAAVVPLCLATAACGLYDKDLLGLQAPALSPRPTGQVLLVWGGASSVGSNGVQLAVASGYEVISTASPRNFDYVRKLGASQVFDYRSATVVDDLVDAVRGKSVAGVLDCVTLDGAVELCAEVLSKVRGNKFISTARQASEDMPGGVKAKFIHVGLLQHDEVLKTIFEDYLPKALAEGKFVPAPDPIVVGKGLQAIQDGLDAYGKGMSAKKVVISL